MLWCGADLSYFGRVALDDILIIESFFFRSGSKFDVNFDTYCLRLFPGSKKRFRQLVYNPLAYVDWLDTRGSTQIIISSYRSDSNFAGNPSEFFPLNLIVEQLELLTDGRLMFWAYNELDLRQYLPDVVESMIVY